MCGLNQLCNNDLNLEDLDFNHSFYFCKKAFIEQYIAIKVLKVKAYLFSIQHLLWAQLYFENIRK